MSLEKIVLGPDKRITNIHSTMSFPHNDKLVSALPEETRLRIQQLAQRLNRSEEEVSKGLMNSLLDLIENPGPLELTGLAKEVHAEIHQRKPHLH